MAENKINEVVVEITKNGKPWSTHIFDNRRKAQAYCCRWNRPSADEDIYKATIRKEQCDPVEDVSGPKHDY